MVKDIGRLRSQVEAILRVPDRAQRRAKLESFLVSWGLKDLRDFVTVEMALYKGQRTPEDLYQVHRELVLLSKKFPVHEEGRLYVAKLILSQTLDNIGQDRGAILADPTILALAYLRDHPDGRGDYEHALSLCNRHRILPSEVEQAILRVSPRRGNGHKRNSETDETLARASTALSGDWGDLLLPKGYQVTESGVTYYGNVVCDVPVLLTHWTRDPQTKSVQVGLTWRWAGKWQRLECPRQTALSKSLMGLARRGFPVSTVNLYNMVSYLTRMEQANASSLEANAQRFGDPEHQPSNPLTSLRAVCAWTKVNGQRFCRTACTKADLITYAGIWDAGGNWTEIAFREEVLMEILRKAGHTWEHVRVDWRDRGWIACQPGRFKKYVRLGPKNADREWLVCLHREAWEQGLSSLK